jgi:hypothetical protein
VDTVGTNYALRAVIHSPPPSYTVDSTTFNATTTPPVAPVINSTSGAVKSVTLNWTGSQTTPAGGTIDKNIASYHIFRVQGLPSTFTTEVPNSPVSRATACGGAKSYTPCTFTDNDPLLQDGTQYSYAIEAQNSTGGISAFSNAVSQFTDPGQATSVAAIPDTGNDSHVTIVWSAPAQGGVTNYDVKRGIASGGPYSTTVVSGVTTLNPVDDFTVLPGTQYFYVVITHLTGATNSRTSAEASALTLPGTVQNLAITGSATKYNNVRLTWNSTQSATSYVVFRGPANGNYPDVITTVACPSPSATCAQDQTVLPGVTYHWAVKAVNATGQSVNFSNDVSTTVPAAPWVPANTGLPGGGWINAIAVDPNAASNVYVGTGLPGDPTTAGGIFKSTNGGASWSPSGTGIPNGRIITALAAVKTGTFAGLYAGTDGSGVFISRDNGGSWEPFNSSLSNLNISTLAVDATNKLYAGGAGATGGGIFKLLSSGSWTLMTGAPGAGFTVRAIVGDVGASSATLYAQVSPGGLYKFAGTTWASFNTGLSAVLISSVATDCSASVARALATDSTTAGIVYFGSANPSCGLVRSTDGGSTFAVQHAFTTSIIGLVVTNSTATPANAKVWVARQGGGVQFAADAGVTFVSLTSGPAAPNALALDPTNTSNLYVGALDKSGLYVSSNADLAAGGSLVQSNTSLHNVSIRALAMDLKNSPAQNAYVLGDFAGMMRTSSANGTPSWAAVSFTGSACTGTVTAAAVDPNTSGNPTVYATCTGVGFYSGATNTTSLAKTTGTNLTSTAFGPVVTVAANGDVYVTTTATTPHTIWKSTDGGATFTALTALSGVTAVNAVAVDGAIVFAATDQDVYALAAGVWTHVAGPSNASALFVDTHLPHVLYAAGAGLSGTGSGAGVWTSPVTIIAWTQDTTTNAPSTVTAFSGRATGGAPNLWAGAPLTAGQAYANFLTDNTAPWVSAANGITGGNVIAIGIGDNSHVLAGTGARGLFITATTGQ